MIKIYIIIFSSLLYINIMQAAVKLTINSEENNLNKYGDPVRIILNLVPGAYTYIIVTAILSGKYFDLFFLAIPLLYALVFMITEPANFMECFTYGLIYPCKRCDKIIIKGQYCSKCKDEILKEKI